MARYTGPITKIARKFGEPIFGADKYFEKKNFPPGQHGLAKKRKKVSEYGVQLQEKQKQNTPTVFWKDNLLIFFTKHPDQKGVTGEVLLQLLESRLDNVVYRFGISPTRKGARQLVNHCHITVNGHVVNIPSYIVKAGDIVGVREKSKSMEVITNALSSSRKSKYSWLEWEADEMVGKFLNMPERADIPENIKEQLIVELYSK